jgi:hypothetical protein
VNILRTLWKELIALFIDDGSFALAILAWVCGGAICIRYGLDPAFEGILLFCGLAVLLVENVWRTMKEHRSPQSSDKWL